MKEENPKKNALSWSRRTFNTFLMMGFPFLGLLHFFPNKHFMDQKIKRTVPRKLSKGDTISLICPASSVTKSQLELAVKQVTSLGFKVKLGQFVEAQDGFLAGTDEQRIQDLHNAFKDPEVNGIWCVRGGYGTTRILPHLDYSLIRKHPKILIGYSDITALFQGIYQETGLIGFHGPVAISTFSDYSVQHLISTLTQKQDEQVIKLAPQENPTVYNKALIIKPGVAEGKLTGGNLALLSALCGTKFQPDYKGKLVFIEDIGEKPYRIDRMLTQIFQATNLNQAAGIIFGIFENCDAGNSHHSWTLLETLKNQTQAFDGPVFYGFSFGHVDHQCVLPIGVKARFDSDRRTLTLLESPVQ